eukprot:scaffold1940_cov312-Prasinococcus_capsulatus_cf.AAC.6
MLSAACDLATSQARSGDKGYEVALNVFELNINPYIIASILLPILCSEAFSEVPVIRMFHRKSKV